MVQSSSFTVDLKKLYVAGGKEDGAVATTFDSPKAF